jgi:Fic family protein
MMWNWQQPDWPDFSSGKSRTDDFEKRLLLGAGLLFGVFKHLNEEDKQQLTIELISNEALKTSEIEGEYLDRDSLQSYIRRQFGLITDNRKISAAEQGIAEVVVDLYHNTAPKGKTPLSVLLRAGLPTSILSAFTPSKMATAELGGQLPKKRWLMREQLNPRQEKVLARMFREGPDGFKGGLSAEKYISITGAPRATTTRDLQDLVGKGALLRKGERKHTRYLLNLEII